MCVYREGSNKFCLSTALQTNYNLSSGLPTSFSWTEIGGQQEEQSADDLFLGLLGRCCGDVCSLTPAPQFCSATTANDLLRDSLTGLAETHAQGKTINCFLQSRHVVHISDVMGLRKSANSLVPDKFVFTASSNGRRAMVKSRDLVTQWTSSCCKRCERGVAEDSTTTTPAATAVTLTTTGTATRRP